VRIRRESWLHPIFWLLSKITRTDYSHFSTTIGSTIYARDNWEERTPDQKYKLLRHELVHIRQVHRFPLGRWAWPLNHLIYSIFYLLFLPVILTFRSKFEREGYTQSMLTSYELHGEFSLAKKAAWAKRMATTFGGSAYMWMWRKKAAYAWALETIRKIHAGEITNDGDRVDELKAA
jgi:hypothetical protein